MSPGRGRAAWSAARASGRSEDHPLQRREPGDRDQGGRADRDVRERRRLRAPEAGRSPTWSQMSYHSPHQEVE